MVRCVGKDDLHQCASYGKMEPAPRAFYACGTKGADIRRELARVPDGLVGPFGARARRGFVVDDDPSGGGLGQEVNPSAQNLAVAATVTASSDSIMASRTGTSFVFLPNTFG